MIIFDGNNTSNFAADDNLIARCVLLGLGHFTTIRAKYGELEFFAEHWQRLQHASNIMELPLPFTKEFCHKLCLQCLQQNKQLEEIVGIRITIIDATISRDPLTKAKTKAIIQSFPINKKVTIICQTAPFPKNKQTLLTGVKTTSYAENFIAQKNALKHGFDEVIFFDQYNYITETSRHNIFLVKNNILLTPPLAVGILSGIMRYFIMQLALQKDIKVKEQLITINELLNANEVFVTNCLTGITPVIKIDNIKYNLDKYSLLAKLLG